MILTKHVFERRKRKKELSIVLFMAILFIFAKLKPITRTGAPAIQAKLSCDSGQMTIQFGMKSKAVQAEL